MGIKDMIKLLKVFVSILILVFIASCENVKENTTNDAQTQRSLAEAEANRQKAFVAQAEKEKIEAELKLLTEKERIAEENALKETAKEIESLEKESKLRHELCQNALMIVQNSAAQILTHAYPLAMNKLSYTSSELLGAAKNTEGFTVTVRLNYSNLFNKPQYLDLQFDYDLSGGYKSWKFVNHSDIIAPKELTLSGLLKLIK